MIFAVLAQEAQKEELLTKPIPGSVTILWADTLKVLQLMEADVYIDLLFNDDVERVQQLKQLLPKPIIINAVTHTLSETSTAFIRINAWPTFLKKNIIEVSVTDDNVETVKQIFNALQWNYRRTPDIVGMVSARIIAAIINEAYYTLGAGIATKQAIDTAMKLGTNYPYGPFEWCNEIGIDRVHELLTRLCIDEERYEASPALTAEMEQKNIKFSS
jgi:3-hydroxybutyryl-CoA dehydrogenase